MCDNETRRRESGEPSPLSSRLLNISQSPTVWRRRGTFAEVLLGVGLADGSESKIQSEELKSSKASHMHHHIVFDTVSGILGEGFSGSSEENEALGL